MSEISECWKESSIKNFATKCDNHVLDYLQID